MANYYRQPASQASTVDTDLNQPASTILMAVQADVYAAI
jgi:hypothetical protein